MNYYERHLGDYAKDTGHLTMLEHGAYGLLLDRYYSTEQGIPADQAHRVTRARSKEEKAAVDAVLSEFFKLHDGLWVHNRADREIEKAQAKINAAQTNGKKGGRPRKNPGGTQEKPTGFSLGSENGTQTKAHQTPDTKHHIPPKPPRGSVVGFEAFWASYPSKVGKGAAEKAFAKVNPPQDLLRRMLDALELQKSSPRWTRDGGQYIPNPATWLNQSRWLDEEAPEPGSRLELAGAI